MEYIQLTGSIVVYQNDYAILKAAVESFLNTELRVYLFVIDNSFTDDLRKVLQLDSSRISYIYNNANLGYGAGHNIALRHAIRLKTQYHLVFNADTFFDKGSLEALYDFMNTNSSGGHVVPKVL